MAQPNANMGRSNQTIFQVQESSLHPEYDLDNKLDIGLFSCASQHKQTHGLVIVRSKSNIRQPNSSWSSPTQPNLIHDPMTLRPTTLPLMEFKKVLRPTNGINEGMCAYRWKIIRFWIMFSIKFLCLCFFLFQIKLFIFFRFEGLALKFLRTLL